MTQTTNNPHKFIWFGILLGIIITLSVGSIVMGIIETMTQ